MAKETRPVPQSTWWQSGITAHEFLVSKVVLRLILLSAATDEVYTLYNLLYIQLPSHLSSEIQAQFLKQLRREGIKFQRRYTGYSIIVSWEKKIIDL